jgi:hypothetical protein
VVQGSKTLNHREHRVLTEENQNQNVSMLAALGSYPTYLAQYSVRVVIQEIL